MLYTVIRQIIKEALAFNHDSFLEKLKSIATLAYHHSSNVEGKTAGEGQAAREAIERMIEKAKAEGIKMPKDEGARFLEQVQSIIAHAKSKASTGSSGASAGASSSSGSTRKPPSPPPFKPNSWVYNTQRNEAAKFQSAKLETIFGALQEYFCFVTKPDGKNLKWRALHLRKATQDEVDAALAHWFRKGKPEEKSDAGSGKNNAGSSSSGSGTGWRIFAYARCQEGNKVYGYASDGSKWITFWGRYEGPYAIKVQSSMSSAHDIYDKKRRDKYNTAPVAPASNAQGLLDDALRKNGLA